MKLIIGNKNYSSWSLRAWLAAREGGFTFEEIRISLFIPGSRERILSHSPSGKVPCLNDTARWCGTRSRSVNTSPRSARACCRATRSRARWRVR